MGQEAFDPAPGKGDNNTPPPHTHTHTHPTPPLPITHTPTNTFSDSAPLKEMIDFYESLNFSDKILFVPSSVFMLFGSD